MRSTFRVLFFLKRDKQKSNGMIPLFCRITIDSQEVRFSMKCDVNPTQWDVKMSKAIGRTTEAVKINNLLDSTKAAIYKIYREIQERENHVTAEKVKNALLGLNHKRQSLLELFDTHNKERKSQIGLTISKSTYYGYLKAREYLALFLLQKYNLTEISIKEIKKPLIKDFEAFLFARCFAKNTVVTLLKKFRHIIQLAIDKEWISKNPFKGYKLQWEETDRGYLTQKELDLLIDFQPQRKALEQARDVFLFCAFTGLSYSDVKHLTADNIQSSFEGKLWIRGKRRKSKILYSIPLLNVSNQILEKYANMPKRKYLLPVKTLKVYNDRLEEIANLCGINKKVTSHLARHTFATLALTKGVSLESVSKMLGHKNYETTRIYARTIDQKIDNEMNMLEQNMIKFEEKVDNIELQQAVNF